MLGVRLTTCKYVCYVSLKAIVKNKQRHFFVKMYSERFNLDDDPLSFALKLVLNNRYNTRTYLNNLINENSIDDIQSDMQSLKDSIITSESSRRIVYRDTMNNDLSVHNIYSKTHNICEFHRVAFTRLRVPSHSLAVETGRWNRKGTRSLPMEERLCIVFLW